MTTATRGAFLIQASILFTPLLASLAGMAPSRWAERGDALLLSQHAAALAPLQPANWQLSHALLN
jgi:hypothetical protein